MSEKPKYTPSCLGLFLLITLVSGCCTDQLAESYRMKTVDLLTVSAAYTNHAGLVLEGVVANYPVYASEGFMKPWEHGTNVHAYVAFPNEHWPWERPMTAEHWALSPRPDLAKEPITTSKALSSLPSGYVRAADLRGKNCVVNLGVHHPNSALLLVFPLAVGVDIATSPLQIPFILVYGMHPHT